MAYAYEITSLIYHLKEIRGKKSRMGSYQVDISSLGLEYTAVIPVRNEEHNINYSLDSILCQTIPPKRIIVAEDKSTDNTRGVIYDLLTKRYSYRCKEERNSVENIDLIIIKCENDKLPQVEIITPHIRLGKGRFINLLVESGYISTPFFLNLDADTIIEPEYVEKIVRNTPILKDTTIAAVYGRLISLPEKNTVLGKLLARGRSISYLLSDIYLRFAGNIWNFHAYLRGPFVLFRTKAYKEVPRPLDNHSGDTAHAWELQKKGYKILIELSARGFTRDPSDIRGSLEQRIKWHGGFLENLYLRGYEVIKNIFNQSKKRGLAAFYTILYYGIISFKYQLTWGFIIPILSLLNYLSLSTTLIYYSIDFGAFFILSLLAKSILKRKYPDDPYSKRNIKEFLKDFLSFYFVFRPMVAVTFTYSYLKVLKDIIIAKIKRKKPEWFLYT